MKAKVIKDLLNKIPDDSEVLFEYSCFIFGEDLLCKEPRIIESSKIKDYFDEDELEDDINEITDSCDFLISFGLI